MALGFGSVSMSDQLLGQRGHAQNIVAAETVSRAVCLSREIKKNGFESGMQIRNRGEKLMALTHGRINHLCGLHFRGLLT